MSRARKPWAAALLTVAVAGSLTAGAMPSQAATYKHAPAPAPAPVVVATGLDNPRGVELLPDDSILIGEAGNGPAVPCVASSPGAITRCLGFSGSVYRIKGSTQGPVATGLPSEAIVRNDGTTTTVRSRTAGLSSALPRNSRTAPVCTSARFPDRFSGTNPCSTSFFWSPPQRVSRYSR